jgi:protein-S-isoprenylcysteine O-methyltransferase Ste14
MLQADYPNFGLLDLLYQDLTIGFSDCLQFAVETKQFGFTWPNVIGVYLSLKDPALLERRKNVGPAAEQNVAQRIIMSLAIVGITALLVFCALDHRFAWSAAPASVSLAGDVLVALGLQHMRFRPGS